MCYKIVRFSLLHQPTASRFAKPLCSTACCFCWLACKNVLSITDLLIIKQIGFHIEFFAEKNEHPDVFD